MNLRPQPLLTFFAALLVIYVGHLGLALGFAQVAPPNLPTHAVALSSPLLISQVTTARNAKRRGLFWLERAGEGYAIDLRHQPEMFSTMFPGYPVAMADNEPLWRDYFSRMFEVDAYNPTIAAKLDPALVIVHSWLGCLDIYKRYGADVVVIGTSETFRAVMPSVLATGIGGSPRVLLCAGSALQLANARTLVTHLRRLDPAAHPRVVFGYSLSIAFVEGLKNIRNGDEKIAELEAYDLREARSRAGLFAIFEKYHEISFADVFPHWTWDDVTPESFAALENKRDLLRHPERAHQTGLERSKNGYVLFSLLATPSRLREDIEARYKPYYGVYDDFKPANCNSEKAEREFTALISELRAFAGHLYVFSPPTTPLATLAAPACLRDQVHRQLRELSDQSHVTVLDVGWEEFGLDYGDFVRRSRHPEVGIVDIQHVNFAGALKVSRYVGHWMKQHDL